METNEQRHLLKVALAFIVASIIVGILVQLF